MTKLIQHDHIKERCRDYNVTGVHWNQGGMIDFIIGLSAFSTNEKQSVPHYYSQGTTELVFSLSAIRSSKKKFAKQFYEKFKRGAIGMLHKNGTQSAIIASAFSDKNTGLTEEEFVQIPEVLDCMERIRSQVKSVEKDLKEERGERRIQELKQTFKMDVRTFINKYSLSRDEVHTIIHDCLKEMEIEDVMKT